jgi:hypothetical protein
MILHREFRSKLLRNNVRFHVHKKPQSTKTQKPELHKVFFRHAVESLFLNRRLQQVLPLRGFCANFFRFGEKKENNKFVNKGLDFSLSLAQCTHYSLFNFNLKSHKYFLLFAEEAAKK